MTAIPGRRIGSAPAKTKVISGRVVGGRTPFGRWFRSLGWRHLVAWLALLFALFPVVWVVSASFNPLQLP